MTSPETILIIEDNQLNLDMARDLLQRAGFQTLEAEDADYGIWLAKEKHPSLILMDMHLPIMNGYEASRLLKNDPKTRDIPIIGFTALAMDEDQKRAIEHGCIGVIAKPFDVDHFAEMVASYLPVKDKVLTMSRPEPVIVSEKSVPEKPLASRCYTVLIVDDNPQNLSLLGDILSQMHQPFISAMNGKDALYLAKEELPDLILLDIMMPEMDGYAVFDELKVDPRTAEIPVIFVSALNKTQDIVKGLQKGAYDHITKPFQVEEVMARVEAVLRTKLFQDALRIQIAEAQTAKQDLEEFLFVASHDMQGPLRKILQFENFIEHAGLEATVGDNLDYLQGIARNAKEMESLLSGLLTLSRINRKGEPFTQVALADVLADILSKRQEILKELGATVDIGDMVMLEADPRQMVMLFDALIDNALKFKREDVPPIIRIHSRVLDQQCEITIEDNGIGFDTAHLERVFKPFQRLHGAGKYPGTGMGLAIAQKIIERHHGSIMAHSNPGEGSTFIVRLPIHQ